MIIVNFEREEYSFMILVIRISPLILKLVVELRSWYERSSTTVKQAINISVIKWL